MAKWNRQIHRRVEAVRDKIMDALGTNEKVIQANDPALKASMQWRKPLSLEEVNRMAPTPEVRERRGRP